MQKQCDFGRKLLLFFLLYDLMNPRAELVEHTSADAQQRSLFHPRQLETRQDEHATFHFFHFWIFKGNRLP